MGGIEPHVGPHPEVQIEEYVVGGAARADAMAANHVGHRHHEIPQVGLRDDDTVGEDARRRHRDLPSRVRDEAHDHERGQGVEQRIPELRSDEGRDHRHRRQHVAPRVHGVGEEHLAAEPFALAALVPRDEQVDRQRHDHQAECLGPDVGGAPPAKAPERPASDLHDHEEQEGGDRPGRHRLELAMPVRMVVVGRLAGDAHADQGGDVRARIGEGVEAVGENADRPAVIPVHQLGRRDDDVQDEDLEEDAGDGLVASHGGGRGNARVSGPARPARRSGPPETQKMRACGTGHQRTCTLPMMYFLGTIPQWRLSELLFRWSPMTK